MYYSCMKKIILIFVLSTLFLVEIQPISQAGEVPYFMYNAANAHKVDLALLYAICTLESKCRPEALNKDDATASKKKLGIKRRSYGMFQMQLATARSLGFKGKPSELMNPETNTWYAAKYLNTLYSRYKNDTIKVISAYNAGKYVTSNHNYVEHILVNFIRFKLDMRMK